MKAPAPPAPQSKSAHLTDAYLREIGITRKEAEHWMKVADLPEGVFEDSLDKALKKGLDKEEAIFEVLGEVGRLAEQSSPGSSLPRGIRGRSKATLDLLNLIKEILDEIQPCGVRAACYPLFVNGKIDSMADEEVARVGRIITVAREKGEIPWEWIVDDSRPKEGVSTWDNPKKLLEAAVAQFRRDLWKDQGRRVEFWCEKNTVMGTVRPVLEEYGVDWRVMHGFASTTVIHDVAVDAPEADDLLALYAGDFDGSGMWMSERDLPGRLKKYGSDMEVRRIALVESDLFVLPTFDVKVKKKDARTKWFIENFGNRMCELDALSPVLLRARVEAAIKAEIHWPTWKRGLLAQQAQHESLKAYAKAWKRA